MRLGSESMRAPLEALDDDLLDEHRGGAPGKRMAASRTEQEIEIQGENPGKEKRRLSPASRNVMKSNVCVWWLIAYGFETRPFH